MIHYNTKVVEYAHGAEVKKYRYNVSRLTDKEKEKRKEEREKEKSRLLTEPLKQQGFIDLERSVQNSVSRTKQKIYDIARSNDWEWFITFTFDPKKINSADYDYLSTLLSSWFHNIKKRYAPELKYLVVPELHKDGLKYHFHGALSNVGNLQFIYRETIDGTDQYTLNQYNLGFSLCSQVKDNSRFCSYITKYITKDLCAVTKGKKRYWASRNLDKPKETLLTISDSELDTALNSFGSVDYAKGIDIPSSFNHVNIFEFDY